MKNLLPQQIVNRFNEAITYHNLVELEDLMTEDYVFIDTGNRHFLGKEVALKAWQQFFEMFPDYENIFEKIIVEPNFVVMRGHSICKEKTLAGPALWSAKIRGQKISEWRVYEDTAENRALLNIT